MSTSPDTQALLSQVGWVRSLAFALVRDATEAEDLAQETLTAAFEHPPREAGAWRSYLRALLRNAMLQRRRSGERRLQRERSSARAEALPSAAESAERLATHREVVAAVESLPEPYRGVVLLRYFDELPPRRIAERSGVPVKTVNTRLNRAHAMLRERLDELHGGDRRAWAIALLAAPRAALEGAPVGKLSAIRIALGTGSLLAVVGFSLWTLRPGEPVASEPPALSWASETPPAGGVVEDLSNRGRARETSATPKPRVELRGHVRTAAGDPVAGAHIDVTFRPAGGFDLHRGAFGEAAEPVGSAISDEEGAYSVPALAGNRLEVSARAAGFGILRRDSVFAEGEVDLVLEKAATIALVVLAEDGTPLPDSRVELYRSGDAEALVVGHTDASGRWTCAEVPPGLWSPTVLPPAGCVERLIHLGLRSGDVLEREVRVRPGIAVDGTVHAVSSGLPLAGAEVSFWATGTPSRASTRTARTDAQGRYRIAGLDPRRVSYDLRARAEGLAVAERRVTAGGDSSMRADFDLASGWSASGVLLAPGGAPVVGAWVVAYGVRPGAAEIAEDWVEGRTDARGAFALPALRSDLGHALFVRASGLATAVVRLPVCADGARLDLGSLHTAAGASLEGVIVRDDGKPASGAIVRAERLDEIPALSIQSATATALGASAASAGAEAQSASIVITRPGVSAAETRAVADMDAGPLISTKTIAGDGGRFRFVDLAGGRYRVTARFEGMRADISDEIRIASGAAERGLRLEIPIGLALSGSIVDAEGRALPGAWLLLFREGEQLEERSVEVGTDGEFLLEALKPGRYSLSAGYQETRASGELEHPYARVTVGDLEPPRSGIVVRLPRTVPMPGLVVDGEGRPLPRAVVDARDEEGRSVQSISDADGRFRVDVAEGTRLKVEGHWPGPGADGAGGRRLRGEIPAIDAGTSEVVLRLQ